MLGPKTKTLGTLESRLPPLPDVDRLVAEGYEAVRKVMRAAGINPTARSRVAFGDDDRRHSSGTLGGTVGNNARVSRVALVQVWARSDKYEMQLHIYDKQHSSTAPLRLISELARRTLADNERCERTASVASGLSKAKFEVFLKSLEKLANG